MKSNSSTDKYNLKFLRNAMAVGLGIVVITAGVRGCIHAPRPEAKDIQAVRAEAEAVSNEAHLVINDTTTTQKSQWKVTFAGKKREYSLSPKTNGVSLSVQKRRE